MCFFWTKTKYLISTKMGGKSDKECKGEKTKRVKHRQTSSILFSNALRGLDTEVDIL